MMIRLGTTVKLIVISFQTLVDDGERTCFQRWFGPMSAGSFRAGILALIATAIGGGTFPSFFRCSHPPLRLQTMRIGSWYHDVGIGLYSHNVEFLYVDKC